MSTHKSSTLLRVLMLFSLMLPTLALPPGTAAAPAGMALQFNGSNQYVTFGDTRMTPGTLVNTPTWNTQANSKLGASSLAFNGTSQYVTTGTGTQFNSATFTVETWFYRTGAGTGVTTGTGGITSAIPLVTKGSSESEAANADINYFLGIDATSAKLVADFEEGAGGESPSLNHPVVGTTTIALNTWYHAAATYDGNKWQLFLNGDLESELVVGQPANTALLSPLAFATSIRSNGTTIQGYFAGRLDEARVWNFARTQSEIQGSMNSEIPVPTSGLLGRWGMNDASGTTASNLNRLGATSFTLEAWVKRAAGGATMSTGTLGLDGVSPRPLAYPVLLKGMGEGESPANVNTNWFLGITSTGVVGADFEDTAGGVNRPAWGTTTVAIGEWHHIAATYNGSCWALYLDGNPETLNTNAIACPNATPESTSYQRAALSAGINSTGGLGAGYFSGIIDEARVWNRALTSAEIAANEYLELTSGTGLIARWGLSEGAGTTTNSSVGSFPGALMPAATAPAWVTGFPDNVPPAAPTGLSAAVAPGAVNLSWTAPADTDIAGYNVYRSATSPVALTGPINGGTLITGVSYSDTTGTPGMPYYYVVRAVDTSGNASVASGEVSATPLAVTIPAAPTGLHATVTSHMAITLAWTDNSSNETNFRIERSPDGLAGWTEIDATAAGIAAYADAGLVPSTQYCYRVAASNSAGNSPYTDAVCATTAAEPSSALAFDGVNDYVTFGQAAGLNAQNFTLETWFKRTGAGASISTGTNGVTLIPLMSKGAPQAENSSVDENYILGIRASDNVLAGDFEIYAACDGRPAGDNNPIAGVTPIANDTWYHAAFTYDGTALRLYLNGNLEATLASTCPPRYDNSQPGALGTTITSALLAQGFFAGVLDEARVWNAARTQSEIRSTINSQITSGTGLVARWGMYEGTGVTTASSVGSFPGTLTNGVAWVTPGAPFNASLNVAPEVTNPDNQANDEGDAVSLQVVASDPDGDSLTYSAGGLPEGLSIGAETGLIGGKITYHAAAGSPYNVTVTVSDGKGGSTPVNLIWNVEQAASGLCENDPSLVACWPMEEGSGPAVLDATAHGNDGAITGSPTWVTGRSGQALKLSGTGQYAIVPDGNSLDLTAGLTLSAWVRPEKVATQNIIKKTTGTTSGNGYEISLSSAGKAFVRLNGSATYRIDSATSYPVDSATWIHIAATYDGANIKLYVNGVLEGSKPGIDVVANGTNLGIGAEPAATATNLFQGALDDVRIYDRALMQEEIQVLAGVRTLTVTKTGSGSGTVSSVPAGIDCGSTCSHAFAKDTLITLTATPGEGSTFTGWSGDATGPGNPTSVTMTGARSVTAIFADTRAPELTITGATADSVAMSGDLATGFILPTTNAAALDHLVQFNSDTHVDEPLEATYFGLKLTSSTVSPADLKAYYAARGVPEPFLTYLKEAADGNGPFVYIKGATVKLVDAAKHDLLSTDVDMTVPDNFPLGAYTVEGQIKDLAGNPTTVTLILKVTGDRLPPGTPDPVSIAKAASSAWLTWPPVTTDQDGNFTLLTGYAVYISPEQPYFDPAGVTPVTVTRPEYEHQNAFDPLNPTNYFYIVRATSVSGASGDSKRMGTFNFPLLKGTEP